MEPEDFSFEEFFAERLKQKGFSVKKLSDLTGISPRHLQDLVRGDFAALPSAPYVRGYLGRLGQVLDFDGEAWWQRIKNERPIKNSGPTDAMPENRFLRKAPTKYLVSGIIVLIVIVFFAIQLPRILGKPALTILSPAQNPYTTSTSPFALQGSTKGADTLTVVVGGGSENVPLNPDGSWQKDVLLSIGPNPITVIAKKFLGRSTENTLEIIYEAPAVTSTPANSNKNSTSSASSSLGLTP
jgi:transcriptional regulator with XRE-family HTH domain